MMMIRLMRQGLVHREIDGRFFIYNLTSKGETRRVYLNAREPELTKVRRGQGGRGAHGRGTGRRRGGRRNTIACSMSP